VTNNGWAQGRIFHSAGEWKAFRWSEENLNHANPTTANVSGRIKNGVLEFHVGC